MKFIAIDLELDEEVIIQIGAVAFDTTEIPPESYYNGYVKHQANWKHLGDLLPYGQDKLDGCGLTTEKTVKGFWDWVNNEVNCKRFIQWGKGDMRIILDNTKDEDKPKRVNITNAKTIYENLYQPAMHLPKQYGLLNACINTLGEFRGAQHCAYNDALNTGMIYNRMYNDLVALYDIRKTLEKGYGTTKSL